MAESYITSEIRASDDLNTALEGFEPLGWAEDESLAGRRLLFDWVRKPEREAEITPSYLRLSEGSFAKAVSAPMEGSPDRVVVFIVGDTERSTRPKWNARTETEVTYPIQEVLATRQFADEDEAELAMREIAKAVRQRQDSELERELEAVGLDGLVDPLTPREGEEEPF